MNTKQSLLLLTCCGLAFPFFTVSAQISGATSTAHRITISLDGKWDVEDSVAAEELPKSYTHTAPVPGLTHSAQPAFVDVDEFQTRELLQNLIRQHRYSQSDYDKITGVRGISHQERNYFWYRKTFTAPSKLAIALLKVNKAQFSTVVYLNGVRIGEHDPCFTAAYFDLTKTIHWNASNELVIRIGAHPNVLPATVSAGTDLEKNRWTPGIYDDVSLILSNNPAISVVQVAPHIATLANPIPSILVQTELHNYSSQSITTAVTQQVSTWKGHEFVSHPVSTTVEIAAGATKVIQQTIPLPNAHLWTPEDPFLYQVTTSTSGDDVTTRFGMREFRFDTPTQRAYLNGRPYFLRGSNIALHRFFEDRQSGTLPWDEAWLHRLLVDIPKKLHWNSFRFTIGPVPDRWLEIADESGLLIQNEYFVWTGIPRPGNYQFPYDNKEMITEYTEWMRDNWNHPSVAIWDATNESVQPQFTSVIIPAVRSFDLSNRPWENSYNAPAGGDDPVEDHQYLLYGNAMNDNPASDFRLTQLESMLGPVPSAQTSKSGHATILNEYGWVWLNRDGSPTLLTQKLYPKLLGDTNTAENRFALQAYLLGGETEFWRAYRRYAGVMHFVYLSMSDPNGFTSDNFIDVKTLKLEPHFERAMEAAFNPLGVYLNFWHTSVNAAETHDFTIAMVNDEDRVRAGILKLAFVDADGKVAAEQDLPFSLSALGAQSYLVSLTAPATPGKYSLEAIAVPEDNAQHPTISHRDVAVLKVYPKK